MGQKSLVDCNSYISFNDLMVSNKRCQLDIFIIVIERYAFQFRKGYLHFYINKKSVKVEKILRDFKLLFDWFRIRQCYIVVGNYLHVWLMFEKIARVIITLSKSVVLNERDTYLKKWTNKSWKSDHRGWQKVVSKKNLKREKRKLVMSKNFDLLGQ